MAFENIQIENGNFTIDRSGASFYTIDHISSELIEKDSSGNVIFSYVLDISSFEVNSLQFDGYYYWSLERQGTAGFRVRKWEIGSDDIVRVEDEFSFISDAINNYDVHALAVENYEDSLDDQETIGTSVFDVVDGTIIRTGDRIIVGPSTAVGFEGEFSFVTVTDKTGNTITVSPALDATFSPGDEIVFSRNFFVFSDTAPGGLSGALYKYRTRDGTPLSVDVNNMFNNVKGATFFNNVLMFVKGGEIIWVDPDSQNISKSQAIDNLNENRTEYNTAYDLDGFSNTIFRLEQEHVFLDSGEYKTEDWSPGYNYNTSSTVPEVYFVAVKAEPPILHKFESSITTEELESQITVTVLDQFRTPVFNRTVDLSSDGGPLSSTQENTDQNGQVKVTYTADSNVGDVTVTAQVD